MNKPAPFAFRVLENDYLLRTDSPPLLEEIGREFLHFRSERPAPDAFLIEAVLNDASAPPAVRLGGEEISAAGHPDPVSFACHEICRAVLDRARGFLALHAGAVSRDGRLILLAGAPGSGKSTLVVRLARRGWVLYSDDIVPVELATGKIHPFPRGLRLFPDMAERLLDASPLRSPGGPKLRIDPAALSVIGAAAPVRPTFLFCLDPGVPPEPEWALELGLKSGGEDLLRELLRVDGLRAEPAAGPPGGYRVFYPRDPERTRQVREILERGRDRIWGAAVNARLRPDFDRRPEASPIPLHEAAFRLLEGLRQESLFGESAAPGALSGTGLFMTVHGLIAGASAWRLRVGHLDEMEEIVLKLTAGPASDKNFV